LEPLLSQVNDGNFEEIALKLFRVQAALNPVYRSYLTALGADPAEIGRLDQVPNLPIEFFKSHSVKTGGWVEETIFRSSGTGSTVRSNMPVRSLDFYRKHSLRNFAHFYGDPAKWIILALLPSYIEQGQSSLVAMADHLIRESGTPLSGFISGDPEKALKRALEGKESRSVLLVGVTYALLNMAKDNRLDLSSVVVMETGGMKGRGRELVRTDVHQQLKQCFNLQAVHSEYGMTELMSQAYSQGDGLFRCPPWMRVTLRDLNDPFSPPVSGRPGIIRVADLANFDTCAFIETADLGQIQADGSFEVLGRADNSDVRGCNLLVAGA
jgi:hypothetical protein